MGMAMMDLLIKDLDKEMQTAEADEKGAAKADTEAALQAHKEEKDSTSKELMGTLETIKALHSDCDWLMQYFDVRKEARAGEIESLGKAKAVLSGADFSLLQTHRSLRGSM